MATPLPPSTPPRSPTSHDPYAALRSPDYVRFALGFMPSSMGLQMLQIALSWEVYERTNDAFALALLGAARALPVIFFALPGGHLADIYDRKKVLVCSQLAFALLAMALALSSYLHAPMWTVYTVVTLMALVRAINGPARQSILPQIVPVGEFHNAVTWNSGVFQFCATAGPPLAGVMLAHFGMAWPVYLCCATGCLVFSVSSIFLKPRPTPRAEGKFTLRSMLAGLGFVRRDRTILAAITLDLFAVLLGGATALMPVYARDILHVGPIGLGVLNSAPYLGALAMALILAHRPPFQKAGPALLWSVAGFGFCTIGFGLSSWFPLSIAMLFVLGALDNISVVVRQVLVQVRTPESLRGRVAAVNSIFIESSNQLGAFESGAVATWAGVWLGSVAAGAAASVVSGGVGTVLVVAGVAAAWPEVRRLGRLDERAGPGGTERVVEDSASGPLRDPVRPGESDAPEASIASGHDRVGAVEGTP